MKNIIITTNTNASIVIDSSHKFITVNQSNQFAKIRLIQNKEVVIKLNKKSISTCNIEMLINAIERDNTIIKSLVTKYLYRMPCGLESITKSEFYAGFNQNLSALETFFNSASHETRKIIIRDHMCDSHTAKMSGMISFSTFVHFNKFCIARMQNNCAICAHCFAARQTKAYKNQALLLARAHVIATKCIWAKEDIPIIDVKEYPLIRLESFGDINNALQVKNYSLFAVVNNKQFVTLWTKNPGLVQKAIDEGLVIPDNLHIGLSSLELNTPELEKAKRYSFINFLFTVYTPEYVKAHDVKINCGALHCLTCGKCYKNLKSGTLVIINELLK